METIEQAEQILRDEHAAEDQRTKAAHFLSHSHSAAAADVLVSTLDDDDYGVHWAASEGLATLGDVAMPAMLHALARSDCSSRVIHGIKHAMHTSSSQQVQANTQGLVKAMHGHGQSIELMQQASALMTRLKIN